MEKSSDIESSNEVSGNFSSDYYDFRLSLDQLEGLFEQSTQIIQKNRNTIKQVQLGDTQIAIKSFKTPNALQGFIYRFFRASKARRSFEYAQRLQDAGIGTPTPIAYFEVRRGCRLAQSYYLSEFLHYDCLIRDALALNTDEDVSIVKAFACFTHELHEKNIEHRDFSTGNTLIRKNPETQNYDFFLVDINRMRFGKMNTTQRLQNFMRISDSPKVVAIIAEAYAACSNLEYASTYKSILDAATRYRAAFVRKRELKYSLGIKKRPTA